MNKLICPKCSNVIDDDSLFCSFCGDDIKKDIEPKISTNTEISNSKNTNKGKIFKISVIIAIISCILFFVSAHQINETAEHMMLIRSVAGDSVAEAYYRNVGKALKGFAMFCRALGVGILAVSMVDISKNNN